MSIPLDRLYNFFRDVCDQDVIIYRFFPYGSKNFADCAPIQEYSWYDQMRMPHVLFHEQEVIDIYNFPRRVSHWIDSLGSNKKYLAQAPYPAYKLQTSVPYQLYNHIILVHSQKNSEAIETLSNEGYIPVHVLTHGLVARDWYRYAEHDVTLNAPSPITHKFLVYNRAWAGSREYRLYFAELLVQTGLSSQCLTKFGFVDNGLHYTKHVFKNPAFAISTNLESHFNANDYNSDASADYCAADYRSTAIEIVLETHFDTVVQHLTEKIFRPIAVGKPFLIAAAPGILDYLRGYGFQTFSPWIDESYDAIQNSQQRLKAIAKEMQRINSLSNNDFLELQHNCNKISAYNKQHFFSQNFLQSLIDEYKENINQAVDLCRKNVSLFHWNQWCSDQQVVPDISDILDQLGLINQ